MHAHPRPALHYCPLRFGSTVSRAARTAWAGLGSAVCLAAVLVGSGCSHQTEGERCDPSNESSDCESGLRCVSLASLHRGTTGAVCCPESPTADICLQVDFTGNEDDEPPMSTVPAAPTLPSTPTTPADAAMSLPDAGALDASTVDAGSVDAGSVDARAVEPGTAETSSGAVAPDASLLDAAAER